LKIIEKYTQIIGLIHLHNPRSFVMTTNGGNWRFLNLCWFKSTSQSSMQTSHRCLYTFQPAVYPYA